MRDVPRLAAAALALATGALLLGVHLDEHPVPFSLRDLQEDPPDAFDAFLLTTDSVRVVGERDNLALVEVDNGFGHIIRVAGPFPRDEPRRPGLPVYVFDAVWAPNVRFEPFELPQEDGPPRRATLLVGVAFEADRPNEAPPPWLALAGLTLLAGALVAFGYAYAWSALGAFCGFVALHGAAQSNLFAPRGFAYLGAVVAGLVALAALGAAASPKRRAWALPLAALTLAFVAGLLVERWLFSGYRPFTGSI